MSDLHVFDISDISAIYAESKISVEFDTYERYVLHASNVLTTCVNSAELMFSDAFDTTAEGYIYDVFDRQASAESSICADCEISRGYDVSVIYEG